MRVASRAEEQRQNAIMPQISRTVDTDFENRYVIALREDRRARFRARPDLSLTRERPEAIINSIASSVKYFNDKSFSRRLSNGREVANSLRYQPMWCITRMSTAGLSAAAAVLGAGTAGTIFLGAWAVMLGVEAMMFAWGFAFGSPLQRQEEQSSYRNIAQDIDEMADDLVILEPAIIEDHLRFIREQEATFSSNPVLRGSYERFVAAAEARMQVIEAQDRDSARLARRWGATNP